MNKTNTNQDSSNMKSFYNDKIKIYFTIVLVFLGIINIFISFLFFDIFYFIESWKSFYWNEEIYKNKLNNLYNKNVINVKNCQDKTNYYVSEQSRVDITLIFSDRNKEIDNIKIWTLKNIIQNYSENLLKIKIKFGNWEDIIVTKKNLDNLLIN